jgi:hypothetical protein
MNEAMKARLASEAPAGAGRWWKIELNSKRTSAPISVSLMLCVTDKRSESLSTALITLHTYADVDKVIATAKTAVQRVGNYQDVIGNYGLEAEK